MTHGRPLHIALLIAASAAASPLSAHHGAAAFNLVSPITLEATVTAFHWANPHALITFTVPAASAGTEEWTAETAGPVILSRAGWTRHTLKPGAQIRIVGQPAKNGSRTMLLQRVVLADGRELTSFIPR